MALSITKSFAWLVSYIVVNKPIKRLTTHQRREWMLMRKAMPERNFCSQFMVRYILYPSLSKASNLTITLFKDYHRSRKKEKGNSPIYYTKSDKFPLTLVVNKYLFNNIYEFIYLVRLNCSNSGTTWTTHWDDNVLTEFSCYIHLVHESFESIDCCEVDR